VKRDSAEAAAWGTFDRKKSPKPSQGNRRWGEQVGGGGGRGAIGRGEYVPSGYHLTGRSCERKTCRRCLTEGEVTEKGIEPHQCLGGNMVQGPRKLRPKKELGGGPRNLETRGSSQQWRREVSSISRGIKKGEIIFAYGESIRLLNRREPNGLAGLSNTIVREKSKEELVKEKDLAKKRGFFMFTDDGWG